LLLLLLLLLGVWRRIAAAALACNSCSHMPTALPLLLLQSFIGHKHWHLHMT
jgi:hypothetical protein